MMEKKVALFFDAYAARFIRSLTDDEVDVNATVHAFAGCFVEASPIGIVSGTNDEKFRESIPKGYDFYKKRHPIHGNYFTGYTAIGSISRYG